MKRKITAAAAFALCVAMGVCACSPSEKEDTFTGKEKEELAWQPNLDRISPEVYADISNLDLKPGTYISVIGKREGTAYWSEVQAGVEQAAEDINKHLGYKGEDKIKVLYNAPADSENIDEQVNILDEELARYPMVIPTVSQPSGLSAMIMPFHEISSQRFLHSPCVLGTAWTLLDSDGYTIHPIPLAEILTEHLPLAALKPKDIVIPPWVPHLYWSVRTDADPLRQWVRSFLISCARRRWSRYCSDDEAGWREAMASLEAASICSVCSE